MNQPGKAILASKIITPLETYEDGVVLINHGVVEAVGNRDGIEISSDFRIFDLRDYMLCPGFVEPHIHGANGIRFEEACVEDIDEVSWFLLRYGTTSFLPTISSRPVKDTMQAIATIKESQDRRQFGADIVGVHLEGPFLNPTRPGAMQHLRPPSRVELVDMLNSARESVLLTTVAPELPGALELVRVLRKNGVTVSIGHSDATYEEAVSAFDEGVTYATHTFNAMRPIHHRDPGLITAICISSAVYAEVIGDLVHLHPAAIELLIKCKGPDKIVLVTDASSALGLPEGVLNIRGRRVVVENGKCSLENGTLAGSVSGINKNVRNLCRKVGVPIDLAIRMATANPAQALGLHARKGSISPGSDADLIVIDDDINVHAAMVGGEWRHANTHEIPAENVKNRAG